MDNGPLLGKCQSALQTTIQGADNLGSEGGDELLRDPVNDIRLIDDVLGYLRFFHLLRPWGKKGIHELGYERFGRHDIDPFVFGEWKQKSPPGLRVGDGRVKSVDWGLLVFGRSVHGYPL